jgi:hypothetical protein
MFHQRAFYFSLVEKSGKYPGFMPRMPLVKIFPGTTAITVRAFYTLLEQNIVVNIVLIAFNPTLNNPQTDEMK